MDDIFSGSAYTESTQKRIRFNTGTFFDLTTGKYEQGVKGHWLLNGGYSTCTTALHGRGNYYKSTLMDSWIMGMLQLYPQMRCFIFDTEFSKELGRLLKFTKGQIHGFRDVTDQVILKSSPELCTIEQIDSFLTWLIDLRKKNKASFKITTPFVDMHGKPIIEYLPTVVYTDSWSELSSESVIEFMRQKGFDDAKWRTMYMENGNKKTLMLSYMNQIAKQHGIIFAATARTGDNSGIGAGPMGPAKELTHQAQKDKIKDAGAKFTTLTHTLMQVKNCRNIQDTAKEAEYPHGNTGPMDLQELKLNSSRNKSNASGLLLPLIVSQENGYLNDVTNFHFLKESCKCEAITRSGVGFYSSSWLPDVRFSRKTLRENVIDNYQLARALELTARYQYIKSSWNTGSIPLDFSVTAEAIFDKLTSNGGAMKDILESTSVWAPIKNGVIPKNGRLIGAQGRETMTLFEVMALAEKQ